MSNLSYFLKLILWILIIGLIIYVIAKLFIFLLPIIIVLIVGYLIYKKVYNEKRTTTNKNRIKEKIIDAEIVSEKIDE